MKPNMVKNGLDGPRATTEQIATLTCQTLLRTVPAAMPGVFVLAGDAPLGLGYGDCVHQSEQDFVAIQVICARKGFVCKRLGCRELNDLVFFVYFCLILLAECQADEFLSGLFLLRRPGIRGAAVSIRGLSLATFFAVHRWLVAGLGSGFCSYLLFSYRA